MVDFSSLNRELKKANQDMDSLVYSTSHDLRAPLASVLGLLNVAKMEKDPSKISEYFEMIEGRINKLDKIINIGNLDLDFYIIAADTRIWN